MTNIYPKYDYISGEAGNGLIVFLHGLACSRKSFTAVIDSGALIKYDILNIDMIGFGESEKPSEFDYTLESHARTISDLVRGLGKGPIHIAAHSMGGGVALLLDKDIIERIATFANLEGNLIGSDCGMFSGRVVKLTYDKYARLLFPKHRSYFKNHQAFDFERTTPEAVYRSSQSLVKWSESGELLERFRNLKCRKMYFYGEENKGMEILGVLGEIPTVCIPRAGHCMMTDNGEVFASELVKFIDKDKY